jgi:hypothetical protein
MTKIIFTSDMFSIQVKASSIVRAPDITKPSHPGDLGSRICPLLYIHIYLWFCETRLLEFAAYYTRSVDGLMDIDLGPNPGLRGAVWKHEEVVR